MNWDQTKNNWKHVTEKIKVTWGKLSEDDITAIAGDRDQLVNILQQRYGYAANLAERKVDDFAQRLNPRDETRNSVEIMHQ